MKIITEEQKKNRLQAFALSFTKDMKAIFKKWNDGDGVNDTELLAMNFFYERVDNDLRMLTPDFNLALRDIVRSKCSIDNCLWARFPNDMPEIASSAVLKR